MKLVFKYPKYRNDTCYIYTITCPETDCIVYVGQTASLKDRIEAHRYNKNDTNISKWVYELKSRGLVPIFKEVDKVPGMEVLYWESFYIQLFKGWGFNLLNTKWHKYILK